MTDVLADLAQGPALYPAALDLAHDTILLVGMEKADYRASSFLDERIVSRDKPKRWFPLSAMERALSKRTARRPLHFIFHAGHVGSTLLSRLIDETGKVLSLREPVPLRTIAEAYDTDTQGLDPRLETLLRLWERGFADTQAVVLKATSATQRLGPRLLSLRPQARAVVLNVSAESYLATILAAPNSPVDLNAHGPERMHRLGGMGVSVPRPRNLGELAAMSWIAEKLTQAQLKRAFDARVLAVDFDAMLQSLENTVERVLDHFAIAHVPGEAAAIARSPALTRYSKAPEHEYSPALRRSLLDDARARYPDEIREALGWIEALTRTQGTAAALL